MTKKRLFSTLLVLFVIIAIFSLAAYLFVLPMTATEYEKIEILRKEDTRRMNPGVKVPDSLPSLTMPEDASRSRTRRPATQKSNRDDITSPSMTLLLSNSIHNPWIGRYNSTMLCLSSEEWAALKPLSLGSAEYGAQLSQIASRQCDLSSAAFNPNRPESRTSVTLAALARKPPSAATRELLALPDGAIPIIPVASGMPLGQDDIWAVIHAYLYEYVNNPAFDPLRGLRRINDFDRTKMLLAYPNHFQVSGVSQVLRMLLVLDPPDRRRVLAVANESLRLMVENRRNITALREPLTRFFAQRIHDRQLAIIQQHLDGEAYRGNTLHYFWGGSVEHVWQRANREALRRQVEQMAAAYARDDRAALARAKRTLDVKMALVNMDADRMEFPPAVEYCTKNLVSLPADDAVIAALQVCRKEHGDWPASIRDLTPDLLNAEAWEAFSKYIGFWLNAETPVCAVLWRHGWVIEGDLLKNRIQSTRERLKELEQAMRNPGSGLRRGAEQLKAQYEEYKRQDEKESRAAALIHIRGRLISYQASETRCVAREE